MHSFLLIGQSNMAGRGFLSEGREIDTSRIYTLRNGRWLKMFRPINPDRSSAGVSLAESFAEQYAKKHDVDVGLICCADGGTKLSQWMPGEALFDHAVFQAKLAQRTSEIVGVLWHQGESDCAADLFPAYRERFESIMHHLRNALDLQDVPFVLGGLGDFLKDCTFFENLENYIHINRALRSIAQNNAMTGFVSAEGLTANPDRLHFSAESLYELGLRYWKEFESLAASRKTHRSKTIAQDTRRNEIELL